MDNVCPGIKLRTMSCVSFILRLIIVNNLAKSVERRKFAFEHIEVAFYTLSALVLPVSFDFEGKVTAKFKEKQEYREYLTIFNAMETILDRLKHFTATLDMSIYQFENECDITHGVANKSRESNRPRLWEKAQASGGKGREKRRSEISRFQRVCNPRMIIYTCERFSAKIERSMDATAVCLNIYSNPKINKQ